MSKDTFVLFDLFYRDERETTFEAYDKTKKQYCYITFPNKKTSWDFNVYY